MPDPDVQRPAAHAAAGLIASLLLQEVEEVLEFWGSATWRIGEAQVPLAPCWSLHSPLCQAPFDSTQRSCAAIGPATVKPHTSDTRLCVQVRQILLRRTDFDERMVHQLDL